MGPIVGDLGRKLSCVKPNLEWLYVVMLCLAFDPGPVNLATGRRSVTFSSHVRTSACTVFAFFGGVHCFALFHGEETGCG